MATIKQKMAMQKVVENRGNISKSMLDAGYTPKTAKNPKNLTESKAWEELMEEFLPDAELARVHKEGLGAKKGKQPDYFARHKYLDTAYKIKKRLTDIGININLVKPLPTEKSDSKLKKLYGIDKVRRLRSIKEDEQGGQTDSNPE